MHRRGLLFLLTALAALAACTPAPEWGAVGLPRQSPQGWSATYATATDSAGSVYLAGSFTDTIYFGNTRLISAGLTDVFVAKWLPATNTFAWAVRAGGEEHDNATALAVSRAGVLVGGSLHSFAADFGTDTLSNTFAEAYRYAHWHCDLFVARLTTAGPAPRWAGALQAGGKGDEQVTALALRGNDLYIGGRFRGAALTLGDTVLYNRNKDDHPDQEYDPITHGFVASMHVGEHGLRLRWARRVGGNFSGQVHALLVQDSSVVVGGSFQGPADDLQLPQPPDPAYSTAYVLKLHDQGRRSEIAWVQAFGGSGWDEVTTLAGQGRRLYVAGTFGSPVLRLGPQLLRNTDSLQLRQSPEPNVARDILVAALDDARAQPRLAWATSFGSSGWDQLAGLVVRGRQLYVAGTFRGPHLRLGNTVLPNPARLAIEEPYLARFTDQGGRAECTWAAQAGGPHDEEILTLNSHGRHLYLAGLVADSTRLGPVRVRARSWRRRAFVAGLELPE